MGQSRRSGGLPACLAMMEVEVEQADRRDENGPSPAHHDREEFHRQHDDERDVEDVVSHHEADDLLVDEARVGIQQGVEGEEGDNRQGNRVSPSLSRREIDQGREASTERELAKVVVAGQAAKGVGENRGHVCPPSVGDGSRRWPVLLATVARSPALARDYHMAACLGSSFQGNRREKIPPI